MPCVNCTGYYAGRNTNACESCDMHGTDKVYKNSGLQGVHVRIEGRTTKETGKHNQGTAAAPKVQKL